MSDDHERITADLRDQLKAVIKKEGITYEKLSLDMDSYGAHVAQIMSPCMTPHPKLSTLARIADAAGFEIQVSLVKKQR